jgi:F-type H+-transporting ATPase subunit b
MQLASSNFLVPNATFVVELVAFLIVLGVLAKYVVPVVNKAMADRQAMIRQGLADAEEAKRRNAEAEEEYKRLVSEGRTQARAVVDEANRMAEQLRTEKLQRADEEYELRVARATADIEAQSRRAAEELRRNAADLAVAVVEKVVGDGLDPESQRTLLDRTIAEVQVQSSTGVST